MSRLNILWVTDHCCYDGILHAGGRLFLNVIPRFDPERFRIVPCMIRSSDEVREIFEKSPLDVKILDRNRFDLRTIGSFRRMIREEQLDVLHLHCYGTSFYGRIAAAASGLPCIIHDYDTDFYFPYPRYLAAADRILGPSTAGAIAANPLVREFMIERRKVPRERVRLMFHPVLPDRYERVSDDAVADVRRKLDIPADARVVGSLTKLAPERGNELLLDAAELVVDALPNAVFVFVYSPTEFHRLPRGYGEDTHTIGRDRNREALEKRVRELGIERNVRFLEAVDVSHELEASFDVIAAPWLSERFSCARLLDAMPAGNPIIGTRVGELPEIVEDGVNGYTVEPDARALAEKLVATLAKPDHLARLREGARKQAQSYHIDHFVKRLEDWYTELAQRKRAA